jgi:hypothetical protein
MIEVERAHNGHSIVERQRYLGGKSANRARRGYDDDLVQLRRHFFAGSKAAPACACPDLEMCTSESRHGSPDALPAFRFPAECLFIASKLVRCDRLSGVCASIGVAILESESQQSMALFARELGDQREEIVCGERLWHALEISLTALPAGCHESTEQPRFCPELRRAGTHHPDGIDQPRFLSNPFSRAAKRHAWPGLLARVSLGSGAFRIQAAIEPVGSACASVRRGRDHSAIKCSSVRRGRDHPPTKSSASTASSRAGLVYLQCGSASSRLRHRPSAHRSGQLSSWLDPSAVRFGELRTP